MLIFVCRKRGRKLSVPGADHGGQRFFRFSILAVISACVQRFNARDVTSTCLHRIRCTRQRDVTVVCWLLAEQQARMIQRLVDARAQAETVVQPIRRHHVHVVGVSRRERELRLNTCGMRVFLIVR